MTVPKVTLLQLKVAVVAPSKVTVPLLALKVGEPEMVRLPAKVIVAEVGALKVPPDMVKSPFKSAPEGKLSVPALCVTVPLALKVE